MSDKTSPRPWRVDESIGGWKSCVSDANGNPVASCWGNGPTDQQEKAEHIAALIVEAVNWYSDWGELSAELERLRATLENVRNLINETRSFTPRDSLNDKLLKKAHGIVLDALGIGAGETPTGKGVGA